MDELKDKSIKLSENTESDEHIHEDFANFEL